MIYRTPIAIVVVSAVLLTWEPLAQESTLATPGARVEKVASGFGFVEGPAADADGTLYFVDIPSERIFRWTASEGATIFREESGRANGLRFDLDGNLVVCEMGRRRVTAITPGGETLVLADQFDRKRLNSPNDLWIDPKGGIYFSDPRYGSSDDQEINGHHVYYIEPNQREIRRVVDDLERPNGIIGTPDGGRVYIADHDAGQTYVYTPRDDGSLTDKRLFVAQGSDGMTMDDLGNIYLTGQDITVYDPSGSPITSIAVPETPANLTFGGPEGRTLFITARTSLYALEMTVSGQ